MATSLAQRLIASTGKTSRASILTQSKFFDKAPLCKTDTPLINALLSGHLDGGLTAGVTMLVGDSRTFKTNMCLYLISQYLKANPEAIMIFVDSEFGAASSYFDSFGIDKDRVIHIPVEDIEQMTFECVQILEEVKKDDKVVFLIDSVSQVSSKKEAADALEGKGTTDMTRARTLNSFWRIVTPKLNLKGVPLYAINSFYSDISNKYAEPIIKGGKQGFLSADAVWFVTRAQEKDDEGLKGFKFTYKAMKSRFVKEGSKFPITVTFDGGIDKYSGIWDLLRESELVAMPSNAWYTVSEKLGLGYNPEQKLRRADLETPEFMEKAVKTEVFRTYVREKYWLGDGPQTPSIDLSALGEDIKIDVETGEILGLPQGLPSTD